MVGVEVEIQVFLTSALYGGEWPIVHVGKLPPISSG
jgi:hypothetical protein